MFAWVHRFPDLKAFGDLGGGMAKSMKRMLALRDKPCISPLVMGLQWFSRWVWKFSGLLKVREVEGFVYIVL